MVREDRLKTLPRQARLRPGRILEKPGDGIGLFVVAVETVIGAGPDMAVPVFEQLGDEIIGNAVRPLTDHPFTGAVKAQHAVIERTEPEETIAILYDGKAGLTTDVEYIFEFQRSGRCLRE